MEIFRLFQYFFFQFNPNFRICSFSKNSSTKKKKKEIISFLPLPRFHYFSFFFLSFIPMEENYRACHRNTIHKRIQKNVWPGSKWFNKFFFPPFGGNSSLQLRQVVVPFPIETIISSVWFRLEKRLIEWRTFHERNCFYVATIHQSENFIPEWETNRLLFRKDGNFVDKILWDFYF